MSTEKTKEERQEQAEQLGQLMMWVLAAAALVAIAPVAAVAGVVVLLLLRKPDRRNSRLVMLCGALPALAGLMLVGGYWQAAQEILDGRSDAGTWIALGAYGVAIGPFVGGVAARFVQRRRERQPMNGPGLRMTRVAHEDRRKRDQAHTRQKKAAQAGGDGALARTRQWAADKRAVSGSSKHGPRIGRFLRGDLRWYRRGSTICEVPMEKPAHVFVSGDSQTGKSEAVASMEEWIMENRGGQLVSISAKEPAAGDETSRRLYAHAQELGQSCNVLIPGLRPYDIMRAGPRELRSRLMDTQVYTEPHHEAGANVALDFVLEKMHQEGADIADLPAVLEELSDRDRVVSWAKRDAFAQRVVEAIDERSWKGTIQRYMSAAVDLAGWTGGARAGGVAFEDAHVTVADLPTSTLPTSSRMLLRLLLSDVEAYIASDRRPRLADGSLMPLTVKLDELGAVDRDPVIMQRVVNMMDRALGSRCEFIVVTQDPGGIPDQQARDTVMSKRSFYFRQPQWAESVAKTFGTVQRPEASETYEGSYRGGSGTVRMQDQWKVNPNELRSLNRGECFVKDVAGYAKVATTLRPKGFQVPDTQAVRALDQELARGRRWLSQGGGMLDSGNGRIQGDPGGTIGEAEL